MSNEVTNTNQELIQKLVLDGDLSKMTQTQKVIYYNKFCESLGLNPLTQPFRIIKFQEKEMLYAMKDCTEQLRKIHGVSITDITAIELRGVYIVTAKAKDKEGKTDASTGVVSLFKNETAWDDNRRKYIPTGRTIELTGDELANALMKAETKAKRRVTLSICGLGILDESEIETIPLTKTEDITTEVAETEQQPDEIGDKERDELMNLLATSTYEQKVRDKRYSEINGITTRERYEAAKQRLLANQLGIDGAVNPGQKEISAHLRKFIKATA